MEKSNNFDVKSNNFDVKSNNFDVKSNNELFKQALVEGLSNKFDKAIEEAKEVIANSATTTEKQIEEMAKIFCGMKNGCDGCMWDKVYCKERNYAEEIYNAGWRKQSDNVIELPCKIGDTVYIIDEAGDGECSEDYVLGVKVLQFFINKHGIGVDLELPLGMRLNTWMVVGKNVFLTEEEAEQALAKMKGGAE